ncbi:8431_t:CDS:2, partial [Diversispora eburnea]
FAIKSFCEEKDFIKAPLNSRVIRSSLSSDNVDKEQKVGTFSLQQQEYYIIEDLLFVMMGLEGKYIEMNLMKNKSEKDQKLEGIIFSVDGTLDPSLKDLTERVLPLATYYISIDTFIEIHSEFEYGFVSHALCAAMRGLLKEYLVLITQLEHQFRSSTSFTLQKLWFYVHPTLHTMTNIHSLILEIREADMEAMDNNVREILMVDGFPRNDNAPQRIKGGGILSILVDRMTNMSGDPATKKLYMYLLSKSSQPYVTMLHSWIYHGEIRDPHDEFMIQEKKQITKENLKVDYNDEYWEKRYTIRENIIPPFLISFKDKILLAGKYINVVRECGIAIKDPHQQLIEDVIGKDDVDRTEVNVNNDVLVAMDELKKPSNQVSLTKLQSLLDLVLRNPSSVAYTDPFKEDVKIGMSSEGLVDQLLHIINLAGMDVNPTNNRTSRLMDTFLIRKEIGKMGDESENEGSEDGERPGYAASIAGSVASSLTGSIIGAALTLDYIVTFPLSLVISRKALTSYQLLFRHLLHLKHVEQLLYNTWTEQAKSFYWRCGSAHPTLEAWKSRVYALRQRMLVFVQQLLYFITSEVLEPQWRNLEDLLSKVSTVDQVLKYHTDFLDTCLKECMLTNAKLLRKFTKNLISLESGSTPFSIDQQERTIYKFEDYFFYHIKLLIDALNFYSATDTIQFLGLVVRLDYNLFYAKHEGSERGDNFNKY